MVHLINFSFWILDIGAQCLAEQAGITFQFQDDTIWITQLKNIKYNKGRI